MKRPAAALGSAVFFAVVPGTVSGLVPWWLTGWQVKLHWWPPLRVLGVLLILAGLPLLVQAFVRFVVEGFGTPAPIAPPAQLVVGGVYRYIRNPMYVSVLAVILGQMLLLGQWVLLWYAAAVLAAVFSFVKLYEEPMLRAKFGSAYGDYLRTVPGWVPRWRRR